MSEQKYTNLKINIYKQVLFYKWLGIYNFEQYNIIIY